MINTNTPRLKLNIVQLEKTACLFIYEEEEILKDEKFLLFIDNLFISAKITSYSSRIKVIEEKGRYVMNVEFLKKYYEHPLENHIVIFQKQKVIGYTPLEEIKALYFKEMKKQST